MTSSSTINLLSPEFRADPYAVYAELRRNRPVCQIQPAGFWAVTRYDDVLAVLKDPQLFSSAAMRDLYNPAWVGDNPGGDALTTQDPPQHTRSRNLVSRAFGGPVLARIEPFIRALLEGLVNDVVRRQEIDAMFDFAVPLAGGVIGNFLELDPKLHAQFKQWTDDLQTMTPEPQSPEHAEKVRRALAELKGYTTRVVQDRQKNPGNDMVTMLVQAKVDGQSLSERELVGFLILLLTAGLDTTATLVTKSLLLLSSRQDLLDPLRAEPALIPAFIDEMLRWDPPTHGLLRRTTRAAEVAGTTIPAGAFVLAMIASANRDETRFPEPDAFKLDRGAEAGLSFGHGPHYCIGAGLARLETRLALELLLPRVRRIERTSRELEWLPSMQLHALAHLPVRLIPA